MVHKYIYIALALAITTLLGVLQFERMANAKLALKVAEQQAVAIDLEQEADEARLGRLKAEDVATEAIQSARDAREALRRSSGKTGPFTEEDEAKVIAVKKGDIVPAKGYWTNPAFMIQATASMNSEPGRREALKKSLATQATQLMKLQRSQNATKIWSKVSGGLAIALAIVILK